MLSKENLKKCFVVFPKSDDELTMIALKLIYEGDNVLHNGNIMYSRRYLDHHDAFMEGWHEYDDGLEIRYKNKLEKEGHPEYEEWKMHNDDGRVSYLRNSKGYVEWTTYENGREIHFKNNKGHNGYDGKYHDSFEEWTTYDGDMTYTISNGGYEDLTEYDHKRKEYYCINSRDTKGHYSELSLL